MLTRALVFATLALACRAASGKPHIITLIVDDFGWANFSPHRVNFTQGNLEFPTPNLAALAQEGMLLDRQYGHKFCGPSRAALQSGRLPIHVTVLDNALLQVNPKDPMGGFQGIPVRAPSRAAQPLLLANLNRSITRFSCAA